MESSKRTGSAVPTSTTQSESCVIPVSIEKSWGVFKSFKLDKVLPTHLKSSEFVSGGPNQLDSVVRLTYADGAVWQLRINEISDVKHTLGYQVISTEPAHQVTSIIGRFKFHPVTDENQTFLEWTTEYSNDVDANVIIDQKYKKLEFFFELKKNLSASQ
jgi:hypothetical protein